MVAWSFAASEEALPQAVRQTRPQTAGQKGIPGGSDGRSACRREIRRGYRDPLRNGKRGRPRRVPPPGGGLTQVVQKRRRGRGDPVHGERLNGVLRDRLTCLTRKTHALAQEVRMGNAAVALRLCAQNWMRPHRAVREPVKEPQNSHHYHAKTPAMAIGLTDHVWSWAEFLLFRPYQYQRE